MKEKYSILLKHVVWYKIKFIAMEAKLLICIMPGKNWYILYKKGKIFLGIIQKYEASFGGLGKILDLRPRIFPRPPKLGLRIYSMYVGLVLCLVLAQYSPRWTYQMWGKILMGVGVLMGLFFFLGVYSSEYNN